MPSLLEALERKYCSDCQFDEEFTSLGDCSSSGDEDKSMVGQRPVSIFIPRQSPLLTVPQLLVLNDCDIDCAGDFDSIKEKCQRVRELDLAQNKLQDWNEVFHILQHMPRVEFLNLSKNHLMGPISQVRIPSFGNLRGIVLNGTYLDWLCLDVLLDNLPILEELHLSLNNYTAVLIDTADNDNEHRSTAANTNTNTNTIATTTPAQIHNHDGCNANSCCAKSGCSDCCCCSALEAAAPTYTDENGTSINGRCKTITAHMSLKSLHFTGNPIESWHEICRLGRVFPSLENLVLAECPISAIHTQPAAATCCCKAKSSEADNSDSATTTTEDANQDENSPHKNFTNLTVLNLSHANISTWEDIDRLAKFPKLKNLRVKNLPLWERLECTEHERRQLLIARLPNVCLLNGGGMISADEREDSERAFIRYYMDLPESERPRRYDELIAKHGKLDPLVDVNLKPDKHVKVFLTYNDMREARMVDVYRTVADLKVKLEKIVGLPANKMRLYYLDQDYKEMGPEAMRYPNKFLYSYNIQPGDEIIIDEKK